MNRFVVCLIFAAVFCGALFLSNPVYAVGCTFASTEATNSFNVAANWSCGHVPVLADNVTIPAATTTSMLSGPISVNAALISGTLAIGSQSLIIYNGLIINSGGTATSTSGTLTLGMNATTTNSGSMGTISGNFLFAGSVQNNGTFDIGAGNVTSTHATTTNAGTINGGTGSLAIGGALIDAGGTFNAQNGTVRTFHVGHLWVANSSLNNTSRIDITSNAVVATTTVGTSPQGVVFDGSYIWVSNGTGNNVSKVDPATNEVVATTSVGTAPRGEVFANGFVWVTNGTGNSVSKIDITTNAVVATTSVGAAPQNAVFDGTFIWVSNTSASNVSKIDTATNTVVATTTVGSTPFGIAFDGSSVWVANQGASSVSKINATTNLVVATTTVGSNPRGIAFDGSFIWVANQAANNVSKIDITTNAVVATTSVGSNPSAITFDGNNIWVMNTGAGSVSKIDITTNRVIATSTIGASTASKDMDYGGSTDPISISLPGYTYRNLQVFNNHTDTISFASTPTILGTIALSGIGKLSAAALTISVLGTATVEFGTTVTSTSGGFTFSGSVTSTGSIGSNSGFTVFNSTFQNNGTFEVGAGSATTTGVLTNSASGLVKVGVGRLAAIGLIVNTGTITESTGKIVHTAESVKLTNSSGVEVSSYATAGGSVSVVYVTVQDSNRNLLGGTIESFTVPVSLDATAGGDSETLTLTETSASSGIFRNTTAFALTPVTAIVTPGNGEFELMATGPGTVTYTDNQDASDVGIDNTTFTKTDFSTSGGTGGSGSGGGGGAATDPATSGIQSSGYVTTTNNPIVPSGTGTQTELAPGEFVDPSNFSLLLSTFGLTANPSLYMACLPQVRSDAKSFGLTLTSAQESAICNFIIYGISHATIKFGSGERRAILRDYFDTMRRSDVVWSDIQRMATGRIMIVRNLPEEQKRVVIILPIYLKIFGHIPNFEDAKENLSWNTMQYRLRFPRNLTLEMMGIKSYQALFLKTPVTPFEWSVVRVLGYVK